MKYRNSLPEIDSDNSAFVQYESMRSYALNKQETFCERSLGLTLLIRQGMLAWIEIRHQCIPADPNPVKRSKMSVFAYEVTSEMVKVMANIALFNLEEAQS